MDLNHTDITHKTGAHFLKFIGCSFQHNGNKKYYTVKNVVYLGELDLWGFQYVESGVNNPIVHVRSHINFFGFFAGKTEARFSRAMPHV